MDWATTSGILQVSLGVVSLHMMKVHVNGKNNHVTRRFLEPAMVGHLFVDSHSLEAIEKVDGMQIGEKTVGVLGENPRCGRKGLIRWLSSCLGRWRRPVSCWRR